MRIIISPLDIDRKLAQKIIRRLQDVLPWEFAVSSERAPNTPAGGALPVEQVFAMMGACGRSNDVTVAVTSRDLTAQGFEYVYGYAAPRQRAAVVSLYRLVDGMHRSALLVERASKEVLHEAGHVLGLGHCDDAGCVMAYSQTLQDTDIKPCQYCANCLRELSRMPETLPEEN